MKSFVSPRTGRPPHRHALIHAGLLLLAALLLAAAVPAEARMATLTKKDGSVYEGELIRQTSTVIVLSVGGIEATFDQEDVKSLRLQDTPEETYRKKRAELKDDDLDGRYELAQSMYEQDALDLAKRELVSLDRDFPNTPRVGELLNVVDAKLRLEERRGDVPRIRRDVRDRDDDRAREGRAGRRGATRDHPFLTPEQINLIKVYEVDLDAEPRVTISGRTLDAFFDRYGDNDAVPRGRRERSEFRRLPGHEQLDLFFRVQARDLYDQVDVRQDPEPLNQFRRTVNPQYIARYFAPTFGHGQIDGLVLFNDRPDDEAEAYTNFYLLTQFSHNGARMIDRTSPESSLLLQWGLERDSAKFPAPDIEGWRPQFRTTNDPDFRRYVQWIETMFQGDPPYGITYPPSAPRD